MSQLLNNMMIVGSDFGAMAVHPELLGLFGDERSRLLSKNCIAYGKSYCELPCREIVPMTTDVLAADTGPEGGLQCLSVEKKKKFNSFHESRRPITKEAVAGVQDWNKQHYKAYGLSQSLYELDPETKKVCGEPNADAFAIVARENNAFIAVADGVNWGEKAFLAARSAVRGCIGYLSDNLHLQASNTHDVFQAILRSFQHAQSCIIDCEATLTTLCAAVVCKLQGINCYALCVVNVGDSWCYVYRKGKCVQEVTIGSHKDDIERDMRNSGGCLGPSDGSNPDLTNLTCSFTFVEEGDIVFLTSDGISDNFDPVVLKKSKHDILDEIDPTFKKTHQFDDAFLNVSSYSNEDIIVEDVKLERSHSDPTNPHDPFVHDMETRQIFANKLMKRIIEQSETMWDGERSAKELCANLITQVVKETSEKRRILENGNIAAKQRYQESKTRPGKLDHSTVAAFEVGRFYPEPLKLTSCEKYTGLYTDRSISGDTDCYTTPMAHFNPDMSSLLGYMGHK